MVQDEKTCVKCDDGNEYNENQCKSEVMVDPKLIMMVGEYLTTPKLPPSEQKRS